MRITKLRIITAIVAVLTLAGLGLGILAYKTVCIRGTDWWAVPGTGDGLDPEARRGRPNDEQFRALLRRLEAKNRLAREVIDGRLTLLEAAACFRDLDLAPPPFVWDGLRCRYPGASDDELHCREVISFVRTEQRDRPGTDAGIVARLEAELNERLGRGDLHLPARRTLTGPASPGTWSARLDG